MKTRGKCPWCGCPMVVGDEHPVLERKCDDCARAGAGVLKERHPLMWRRFLQAQRDALGNVQQLIQETRAEKRAQDQRKRLELVKK